VCAGSIVKWPDMPAVEREDCVDSETGEGSDCQFPCLTSDTLCHLGDPI